MKLDEIVGGTLDNVNVPEFKNPKKVAIIDGYNIMSDVYNGYDILGILDDNSNPMSYCLLQKLTSGMNRLVEIHTLPAYKGNNLGACILSASHELGLILVLLPTDMVSIDGRNLIKRMVANKRLIAKDGNGNVLSIEELATMVNTTHDTADAIILEGILIHRFPGLNPMWSMRNNNELIYD